MTGALSAGVKISIGGTAKSNLEGVCGAEPKWVLVDIRNINTVTIGVAWQVFIERDLEIYAVIVSGCSAGWCFHILPLYRKGFG